MATGWLSFRFASIHLVYRPDGEHASGPGTRAGRASLYRLVARLYGDRASGAHRRQAALREAMRKPPQANTPKAAPGPPARHALGTLFTGARGPLWAGFNSPGRRVTVVV